MRRILIDRLGAIPGEREGVLHVAAVWRPPGERRNVVLRIGEATPKSAIDFLVLNLARARADAIVATGRILREESALTHDLQGTPGVRAALHEWRSGALGLAAPPWLVVLSSGRELDPGHPAFDAWARPIVMCPEPAAEALRRRVAGTRIEVVGHPAPSLHTAIGHLRDGRGARRISIEAGPTTAIEAYRPPLLIDELLLSVFLGDSLADGVAGGELPESGEIERLVGPPRAVFVAEEDSGRWRYEHYEVRARPFG